LCDLLVNLPYALAAEARDSGGDHFVAGESIAIAVIGVLPFLIGGGALAGAVLISVINSVIGKLSVEQLPPARVVEPKRLL
jgi:hypothetical protein